MDDSSKACGACRNMEAYWEEKKRKEQESILERLREPDGQAQKDRDAEPVESPER